MNNEISVQRAKALELHNRIMVSAQLVQTNLWDMCTGLKEMRDGKLYKELGYQNFEEYCGTEFSMTARNARNYISIVENISPENRKTFSAFSSSKLYLLSTLSEPDQEKITAENDVQSMTVRELEQQIKELKTDNERLNDSNTSTKTQLDIALKDYRRVNKEKTQLKDKVADLEDEITELRSRPIEVAVAEPSKDVRQLEETIKSLELSTERQMAQMEDEHLRDVQTLHKKADAEKEEALRKLTEEYEEKLAAAGKDAAQSDDKQVFKAYYSAAYDAFYRMIAFTAKSIAKAGSPSEMNTSKQFYQNKIAALIDTFSAANKDI